LESIVLLLPLATIIVQLSLSPFVHSVDQNITMISAWSSSHYYKNFTISTRGHFDLATGELIPEHNSTAYLYYNDIRDNTNGSLQNEIICPSQKEIAIYIHGVWTDENSANEQVNRTAMSLEANNNTIPLIGFSWDSNTPFSEEGWKNAKTIAANNGPKLAQFILDFKNKCEDTEIRLIAHSLGAAVVNNTLVSLSNNQEGNTNFNITSVHLLGAAIDRSGITANTTFGKAIEYAVDNFYNLRNSEDNMLEYIYKNIEDKDALGLLGIQHSQPIPRDYIERQVDSEIPPIQDADGNSILDCFDYFVLLPGDNHCGYIGFRGIPPFENILRSDGSMDVIVQDWQE
jgi:esterase/lipase superfamily enzyme